MTVTPRIASVPLGAPVDVNVKLTNTSRDEAKAPPTLSLACRGHVIDRSGTVRPFEPLTVDENEGLNRVLKPGQSMDASLTLNQGIGGPLFPRAGAYRVVVEANWRDHGLSMFSVGETAIRVVSSRKAPPARRRAVTAKTRGRRSKT